MLDTASAVETYLETHRVAYALSQEADALPLREISVERIAGGVSNHVWRLVLGDRSFILKQPLHRLAVREEWISGTGRLDVEVAALRSLAEWIPGSVPQVRFHDPSNKVCIMTAAPFGSESWKGQMMGGSFNAETAMVVGKTLRDIHERSSNASGNIRSRFESLRYFRELRIDPFHLFVASKYPDLEEPIEQLINDLIGHRSCFVHGDYSPKNILVDPDGRVTVIDLEVAHWGNPVFDVAYCLGHLMLKGWHLGRPSDALESIGAYLKGYGSVPGHLITHLGLMLLARIDGKSTVEYLTDPKLIRTVRAAGRSMLLAGSHPLTITDLNTILARYLS